MRSRIIMETIEEINENGLKFTMASLATRLAVSKSTIYANFAAKEELIGAIVDYLIEEVRSHDEAIMNNNKLDFREKLEALFLSEPKVVGILSNRFILELRKYMPKEWKKTEEFRQQRWQLIEALIKEGINRGFIRPIDLSVIKIIFEVTINEFLSQNYLIQNNLTPTDAINKMSNILYYGIAVQGADTNSK